MTAPGERTRSEEVDMTLSQAIEIADFHDGKAAWHQPSMGAATSIPGGIAELYPALKILAAEVRRLEAELVTEKQLRARDYSDRSLTIASLNEATQKAEAALSGRTVSCVCGGEGKLAKSEAAMAEIRGALEAATWTLARTKTGEPAWCTSCEMHYPNHMDICRTKKALAQKL